MDILSFESAFCYVSDELNNLPICIGGNFKDLSELDVLTPNRLLLGRNNRRSMSGPCKVDSKSRMLEAIESVFQAWWEVWNNTPLADFVSKHHEPCRPLCCPLSKRRGIGFDAGVSGSRPHGRPPGRNGRRRPWPPAGTGSERKNHYLF